MHTEAVARHRPCVTRLDRLGRTLRELLETVDGLKARGVHLARVPLPLNLLNPDRLPVPLEEPAEEKGPVRNAFSFVTPPSIRRRRDRETMDGSFHNVGWQSGMSASRSHASRGRGGFLAGVLTGVALSGGVFLAARLGVFPYLGFGEITGPVSAPLTAEKRAEPRFEFYTLLPAMEVEVETEPFVPRAPKTDKSEEERPASDVRYVVQAGSFRRYADADTQKARLALLGLESVIHSVSINGGETWHRVRLGPLAGDALAAARAELAENRVETMLFKSP